MFRHTSAIVLVELAGLGLAVALGTTGVHADTIYVCWDGSGDYRTIQEGIDAAGDGDEVVVCDGVYTGYGNKNLDFHGKAITVRSANGPDNCIIDCENDGRSFYFHNAETKASMVQGFTMTNGYGWSEGGGICCDGGSGPTVANCTITGNFAASYGGGVCCWNGSLTLTDCTITDNATGETGRGGGVYCAGSAQATAIYGCVVIGNSRGGIGVSGVSATLTGCTVSGNRRPDGSSAPGVDCSADILTITDCTITHNDGGVRCREGNAVIADSTIADNGSAWVGGIACSGDLTLRNCTIAGNEIRGGMGGLAYGGGIRCSNANVEISNCTIAYNAVHNFLYPAGGGGIYSNGSVVAIHNCAFIHNHARYGGALYCKGSTASLGNCTFIGNCADQGRALLCFSWMDPAPSDVTMTNCVLWNGGDEVRNRDQSTITITYSDVFGGWPGQGNIEADPLFARSVPHLQADSPCRDAGDPNGDYDGQTDTDGEDRVVNGRVDIGADEFLDTDDDALPDWWELLYFDSETAGDPAGDDDGDGLTNLQEYIAGRNPWRGPLEFYVDLGGDDAWDGLAPEWDGEHGPKATIQAGIDAAEQFEGDIVNVADGTYTGLGNRDVEFRGKALTLQSAGGLDNCIIDCEQNGRGFYIRHGETRDAVLSGFTIQNGYVNTDSPGVGSGGGIHCVGTSPAIADCKIQDCIGQPSDDVDSSGIGGGIGCQYGSSPRITNCAISGSYGGLGGGIACRIGCNAIIEHCTIEGNSTDDRGGGIYCSLSSSPEITNCTIVGNTADLGGGIYCHESHPAIMGSTIVANDATYGGGVCGRYGSNPTVTNSVIVSNSATYGGGLCSLEGSSQTTTGCTITANSASYGGGLWTGYDSSATITNCTIVGNWATLGGAVYSDWDCVAMLTNCIIAANAADSGRALACDSTDQQHPSDVSLGNCVLWNGGDEIWNNDESTISIGYSDIFGGWAGAGNIDADPLFVDPDGPDDDPNTWEDNDFHLSAGSPCIDAGCNWAVPPDIADLDGDGDTTEPTPLDLDGEGRFFDDPATPDSGCGCPPLVDMGAYEFGDAGPQPCPGDLDCDRVVGHSDLGIFLTAWHISDEGDLNCDGETDHADLGILLRHWGESCP